MITRNQARLVGFLVASDIAAIVLSYLWSFGLRFSLVFVDPAKGVPPFGSYLVVLPLYLGMHLAIFYFQGFYKSRLRRTNLDDLFFIGLNAVLTVLIVWGIILWIVTYVRGRFTPFGVALIEPSNAFLVFYFVSVIIAISVFRHQIYFIMKRRFARGYNLQNVLVVGASEMGVAVAQKLIQYKDLGFVVKGFLDNDRKTGDEVWVDGGKRTVLGRIEDLSRVIEDQNIQEVYVTLALSNYSAILETLQVINKYPVNVRIIPDLFQLLTLKANVQDLDGFPVISIDEVPLRGFKRFIKRVTDVVLSAVGLVVLSPLFLVVAVLIKLTSKGPVFYHQERVSADGKHFVIHKFRSMVCDAEKDSGPVFCSPDDPRMTKIGRVLRKFSIDEFPQLANVFKGDISLVGPRAERPEFVKEFTERIPKYMLRHKVKSGITGWAQVHGLRQSTSIEKRLEHDLYYIQNWSFALDLKILWMTFRRGFIDKGFK